MFETNGTSLVETSLTGIIWGMSLSETNPDRLDRKKWKGTNWLGEILTHLREDLIKLESKNQLFHKENY